MAGIALLDCAMRMYTNHPCRMILAELENDLPCKESTFSSEHPFIDDGNIFAPKLTVSRAFALLFQVHNKKLGLSVKSSSQNHNKDQSSELTDMADLTKFDLFILIHCKPLTRNRRNIASCTNI